MRFYAGKFGEDEEQWGLTGLLHDFDWEIHPTLAEHPAAGAPILRARAVNRRASILAERQKFEPGDPQPIFRLQAGKDGFVLDIGFLKHKFFWFSRFDG